MKPLILGSWRLSHRLELLIREQFIGIEGFHCIQRFQGCWNRGVPLCITIYIIVQLAENYGCLFFEASAKKGYNCNKVSTIPLLTL